jgi:F-type H+-transporting ATPase subunit a
MAANPLHHVLDNDTIVFFERLGGGHLKIDLPAIPLPFGHQFQITKFMVLEVIVALIIIGIYVWPGRLAQRLRTGEPPRGWFQNLFELLLTFIRDEVAIPYIGEHDADRFLPFLWTLFLFILLCNLLGMIPFAGSPTASLAVTLGLAVCAFVVIHGSAIARMGLLPYLKTHIPDTGLPVWMVFPLLAMIFVIEIFGDLIRGFVLGIRLFANMLGGHTVLAVMLMFIAMANAGGAGVFVPVTVTSVAGAVLLSLLELFVACLQAFIFVFLTALFLGSALHPEH